MASLIGHVDADDGKIAVFQFPNIRAIFECRGFLAVGVRVRADSAKEVHRVMGVHRQTICPHFGCKKICWQNRSVNKTVHSKLSKLFCEHIRSLRATAGMTQRDLAEALGREHGMVGRIELGERRVDFVEAFALFQALGADPVQEASALMVKFKQQM